MDTVVFDKTGTLTLGRFGVDNVAELADLDRDDILSLAGAIESLSEHPIARAIADAAPRRLEAEGFSAIPGKGAHGRVGGHEIAVVSPGYLAEGGLAVPPEVDELASGGSTVVVVLRDGTPAGAIALSDTVRPEAATAVRRLADSAERVRRRIKTRVEIPDFTRRRDEIGELSGALREMTNALYTRIEAIESFAADVAHELKNPLTSLRSAVETLPMVKNEESRQRLLAVIHHDIRRLDRLISDISDASRLDAELQRQEAATVDLTKLLDALVTAANEIRTDNVSVTLAFEGGSPAAFKVPGHDSRLGQVISNLLDNARSFSPPGGKVRITCRRLRSDVEIIVDDDGSGIRPEALDKIFERFYTDRPHQGFGQNSGLGLSISKQIVEAHGGSIRVENRTTPGPEPRVLGARFVVRLPAI